MSTGEGILVLINVVCTSSYLCVVLLTVLKLKDNTVFPERKSVILIIS